MKITFLMSVVSQNGGGRVVAIYAEKLLAMGHDVKVVSRIPQEKSLPRKLIDRYRGVVPPDPDRTAMFDFLGERHIQIPWKFPIEPADVPEADVVIATWWRTAFEVATLPPSKGKKLYFVQHHEVHDNQPWDLSGGSYWLPLKKITIADWLVETMAQKYRDTDVIKVENSVDTTQFRAAPRDRNTIPTVGMLYSPTRFKGIDISLRALDIARQTFPDLKLIAFGTKAPTNAYPLPPGSEFHLLPKQDALRDLYSKCDVWLCGSRAEGFHLPPLEAMACRTPVVSTRVGGATETVTDGVNGYLAPVEDADALGQRLVELLEKPPEVWKSMSDAALARAESYSWEDAAEAFQDAIQTFMRKTGTSCPPSS